MRIGSAPGSESSTARRGVDGAAHLAGVPAGQGELVEHLNLVDVGWPIVGGHRVPEVEPSFQVPRCRCERIRARTRAAGSDPRRERSDQVMGGRGMMGNRREVAGTGRAVGDRSLAKRRRIARVMAPALGRQEVLVHGLLEQGVSEGVQGGLTLSGRDHDPGRHRFPHRRLQAFVVQGGNLTEQLVLDGSACDGGNSQQVLDVVRQRGDAAEQYLAEVGRQLILGPQSPGRQKLLHVEGVALGPLSDRPEERLIGRGSPNRFDEVGQRTCGEVLQRQPAHPRRSLHLGEPRADRVATMDLVGPVRAHDQQALGAGGPGDERQHIARRAVRPVEVFHHEQDGLPIAEPLEHPVDCLQHPGLNPVRAGARIADVDRPAKLGYEPAERGTGRPHDLLELSRRQEPSQRPERVGDRGQRQPFVAAQADRRSLQDHATASPGMTVQLGHQAALADPRLATDEDG